MADLPATVGYLTVKGRVVTGGADSTDGGNQPDMTNGIGTVTFTSNVAGGGPIVIADEDPSLSLLYFPETVVCALDGNGEIVAPVDGLDGDPGTEKAVRLPAPLQSVFQPNSWTWTAAFTPGPGQNWSPFSRVFTGIPGDTIYVPTLVLQEPQAGVLQGLIYEVPTTAEPYPIGFRPEADYLLTPDHKLWRIA